MEFLLNGIHYSGKELLRLCRKKLAVKDISTWEKDLFEFINDWVSNKNLFKLKTSGSTGAPKEITVTRKDMIRSAQRTLDYFNLRPGESILCALPVKYIAGKMVVVRALEGSLDLIIVPPSNDPLKNMIRSSIDFCSLVPYQINHILKNGSNLGIIKKILIGGAHLNESVKSRLKNFPSLCYESYGMTETLSHVAVRQISPIAEEYFSCLPEITVSVNDKSQLVFNGKELPNKPVVTNDFGFTNGDSQFIFIGRMDNVINSGGVKISPEKVELAFEKELPDRPVIVMGEADNDLGEEVVIVFEGSQLTMKEKLIIANIVEKLDEFKKPRKFYLVNEFPRSENGKKLRRSVNLNTAIQLDISAA